ncbi:MAG: hypothetical protein M1818_006541 [Claussenomyces sp. TS43310]|nr:MAG: hypothetical protein M1818_006541 [Claussenomyces sp. TS43310]
MDIDTEQEKLEEQSVRTADISTNAPSDVEKHHDYDTPDHLERSSHHGEPDLGHEEVEQMDSGHQLDLSISRQETHASLKAGPRSKPLERTATQSSVKSKISSVVRRVTSRRPKEVLERAKIPEMDLDNGIVGWEGQDDPAMPLNFPDRRKWFLLMLLSSITFISPLASSMFAPGVEFMSEEFGNTSAILSSFCVSVFVLGFAVGPLVLSPLSEIYGRSIVLSGGNWFFVVWQIGCALAPNLPSLAVFRFLAGIGGSSALSVGGGLLADMFPPEMRGLANSIWSAGPLFGPVIGPVCGGFIAQRAGWRWVFWVLLMVSGVISLGISIGNRETNHRVLIHRRTQLLRKELNRPELRSCYDSPDSTPRSAGQILRNGMLRPLKMLFLSPIVFFLSLYMSVVYGLLYLLFTTITMVFQTKYGWAADLTGLSFIAIGIGFVTGLTVVAKISDATVVRMTKSNNGVFEPEFRLPACIFFACFIPVGLFWYGWSSYYRVFWLVPLLGLIPFGFGMIGIFVPIVTYLVDSFPTYAASALAGLTAVRSLFGCLLPLAGPSMYDSLGLGWGNTLLGFIALILIPAPALIFKYGERIRKNHPLEL